MQFIERAYTADGEFAFLVEGEKPGLIGESYYPVNDKKATTVDKCYCETDRYYYEREAKEPIPENAEVEVIYYWRNFYGSYFRVFYNRMNYDVKPKYLKFLK